MSVRLMGPVQELKRFQELTRVQVMTSLPVEIAEPAVVDPETDDVTLTDKPWIVIVWNDPVNLMSYVVFVLQKLFGFSREKATRLMLAVHHEGKAVVADGTREQCEGHVGRLHGNGLWATMEHPS